MNKTLPLNSSPKVHVQYYPTLTHHAFLEADTYALIVRKYPYMYGMYSPHSIVMLEQDRRRLHP